MQRRGGGLLDINQARKRRDLVAREYLLEREKAHEKAMEDAQKALNKFKQAGGGKRQGEQEADPNIYRQWQGSGYQKSDLSDEMLFSESMAELSMDKRDMLDNVLSSQHPSAA